MEQLVTDKILEQIMEIRREAKHNMLDTTAVQREAFDKEFYELTLFIEENRRAYWDFIMRGDRGEKAD